ncbi:MAG: hypothetical protein ABIH39_05025, partial [Candidatus Margulisiibacteriota bacterium]
RDQGSEIRDQKNAKLNTRHSMALLFAAVSLFLLGWVHPYDVFALDVVIIAACCYRWYKDREGRIFIGLIILLAAGLLPLIFHFYWSYLQFTGRGFMIDDYPVPFYYLPVFLGLNFILIVIAGLWSIFLLKNKDARVSIKESKPASSCMLCTIQYILHKYWFLVIWMLAGLAMLFVPFYFRRKLFLGVPIAINLLAGMILIGSLKKLVNGGCLRIMPVILLAGYLVLASWGNIAIVGADVREMLGKQFPYFIATEKMEAFRYLQKGATVQRDKGTRASGLVKDQRSDNTRHSSLVTRYHQTPTLCHPATSALKTVLCHPDNGMLIPVYSGQKVYAANWLWTADLERKKAEIHKFFAKETADSWRQEFLKSNKIDYLYYGLWERNLGGFEPGEAGYLKKVFDNGIGFVYRVHYCGLRLAGNIRTIQLIY